MDEHSLFLYIGMAADAAVKADRREFGQPDALRGYLTWPKEARQHRMQQLLNSICIRGMNLISREFTKEEVYAWMATLPWEGPTFTPMGDLIVEQLRKDTIYMEPKFSWEVHKPAPQPE